MIKIELVKFEAQDVITASGGNANPPAGGNANPPAGGNGATNVPGGEEVFDDFFVGGPEELE